MLEIGHRFTALERVGVVLEGKQQRLEARTLALAFGRGTRAQPAERGRRLLGPGRRPGSRLPRASPAPERTERISQR